MDDADKVVKTGTMGDDAKDMAAHAEKPDKPAKGVNNNEFNVVGRTEAHRLTGDGTTDEQRKQLEKQGGH